MTKKWLIFCTALLCFSTSLKAQDFIDNAYLFSKRQTSGSARFQAIGGAGAALGGDYSAALINPAGLGMFNRSEFTFSLGLTDANTNTNYFGSNAQDNRSVFNIPGFSYIQKHDYSEGKFLGGAFGFAFTRTQNLNTNYQITGINNQSTIIDFFIEDLVDQLNEFNDYDDYSLSGLAFNSFLTDEFTDQVTGDKIISSQVFPNVFELEPISNRQTEVSIRKGAQSQLSLSYGGNFDDVLFLGASVGITTLRYTQEINYREDEYSFSETPSYNAFNYLNLTEIYDIQGSGVNLTLGAIYRPLDFLQIGISYATPTLYNLTDTYTASLESQWNNFDHDNDPGTAARNNILIDFDVPLVSEYDLRTPARLNVGATAISKFGFFTAELEWVNYKGARYSSNVVGFNYDFENEVIRNDYKGAINIKMGAEFRKDKFRLRAGFNRQGNPYNFDNGIDNAITSISGGLGYRSSTFFVDLAVVNTQWNSRRTIYNLFDAALSPSSVIENNQNQFVLTLGFPF